MSKTTLRFPGQRANAICADLPGQREHDVEVGDHEVYFREDVVPPSTRPGTFFGSPVGDAHAE